MADKYSQAIQAQSAGQHDKAISLLKKLNAKKKTRTVQSVIAQSRSNLALGDWQAAHDVLRLGLSDKVTRTDFVELSKALGAAFVAGKGYSEALRYLRKAEKVASSDQQCDLILSQAFVHSQNYQLSKAVKLCSGLLQKESHALRGAIMLMDLALQLSDLKLFDTALETVAADLASINDVNLLALVERVSRYRRHRADLFFEEARRRQLMPHSINLFEARKLLEEGEIESARRVLDEVEECSLGVVLKPLYWKVRASLQEIAHAYEEAFESYRRMNKASAAGLPPNWREAEMDPVQPFRDFPNHPEAYESPVPLCFIVGFPRSGTTLLEVILDSQADIEVLDEKPVIHGLKTKLLRDGYALEDCLTKLDREYLQDLREHYFNHASEYLKSAMGDIKLLVDKNPMQMIDLPLINLLFPEAKILWLVRHPLDTILSCYQQTFEINSQMPFFTEWGSCFSHYHDVTNSFEQYRSRLDLKLAEVRYEDLVQGFDVEVERVFSFLDISPDVQAYRQFGEFAENRIVNTPSGSQVRKGLYKNARFRWKNYVGPIGEHIDVVLDDILRLGYEVT